MRNKAALITESSKEIGLARARTSAKYGAITSLAYINKPDAQIPATKTGKAEACHCNVSLAQAKKKR